MSYQEERAVLERLDPNERCKILSRVQRLVGHLSALPWILPVAPLLGALPVAGHAQGYGNIMQNLLQSVAPIVQQQEAAPPPPPSPYQPQGSATYPPANGYQPQQPYYAPSPSVSIAPRRADSGPDPDRQTYADMQQKLDDLGYDAGPVDGAWGARSAAALRAFQQDHGLAADDRLSASTQQAVSLAWSNRQEQLGQAPGAEPSFSCARASSSAEQEICRNPELAGLDRQLAAAYSRALSSDGAGAGLAVTQREWVKVRNTCGADVQCLRESMTRRIAQLQTGRGQEEPWEGVSEPAKAPEAAANAAVAAVPSNQTSSDPLESLEHPPTGFQPWLLKSIDGKLVLPISSVNAYGVSNLRGASFFRLLADTNIPQGLENERDLEFLSGLLDESTSAKFFTSNLWAGSNNIEQQASHDAFFQDVAPRIRRMAPKLPLVLRWTEIAMLGDYDLVRGGFPVEPLFNDSISGVAQLQLNETIREAGLAPIVSPSLPDLFWAVDRATADALLKKLPARALEFVAVVELGRIDPDSTEISVKLDRLSLYTPDLSEDLHDYALNQTETDPASSGIGVAAPEADVDASVAASSAADAGRWHLPMLNGLPWINPPNSNTSGLAYSTGFGGDIGMSGQVGLRSLTPGELWSRAIYAMGLAQTPNTADITDQDTVLLACIFLSREEQMKLFRHLTCGSALASPEAQFDLEDGAAAFRSQILPRIQAAAPRIPFQFLYVQPMQVGRYDETRKEFALGLEQDNPIFLFDSPLDAVLPTVWPATRDEARNFVESQQGNVIGTVWVAMTVSITGALAGHEPGGERGSGLLGGGIWRFHTDSMRLYADNGLRHQLYDFTANMPTLPPVIQGTPAEKSPPPVASVPLTPETALIMLLHADAAAGAKIDWAQAAAERQAFESGFRTSTEWKSVDPWGVFSGDAGFIDTSAYKDWTVMRSKDIPDSVTISRLIPPYQTTGPLKLFGKNEIYLGLGSTAGDYASPVQNDPIAALGIDSSQLFWQSFQIAGSEHVLVDVAFPEDAGVYQVDPGSILARSAQPGAWQARLVITNKLDRVRFLPAGLNRQAAVLLQMTPITAEILRGPDVLVSLPVAGPQWQNMEPTVAGQQRQTAAPYNPDVLGIRLGMKMSDAEALARAAMHVSREMDTEAEPPRTAPPDSETSSNAMLQGHLFVNDATHEALAIFEAPHEADGRVLAIWRNVQVPKGSWPQILPRLTSKYGSPVQTGNEQAVFAPSYSQMCVPNPAGAVDTEFLWMKGGEATSAGVGPGIEPSTPLVTSTFTPFADCGPVVSVAAHPSLFDLFHDPNENLEIELFDLGALANILSGPKVPPPPSNTVSSVKF